MKMQEIIDREELIENRRMLNEFTAEKYKRQHEREIAMDECKRLDEIEDKFLFYNKKLTFEEMLIVRKVFDFIKKNQ